MKRCTWMILGALLFAATGFCQGILERRVRYTLLEESHLVDDCLVCGRPAIIEPLRGTFDLVLLREIGPYTWYAVENVQFTTSGLRQRSLSGKGSFTRFEEFARVQTMQLHASITDEQTTLTAWFTNSGPAILPPEPLMDVTLAQTNGTPLQTFSLRLLAAPVREVWFSTSAGFGSTNRNAPTNWISDGMLLSNLGRVVRYNHQLAGRLGVMPVVPDLGLDAVHVGLAGLTCFSIPKNTFSESQGLIQHGDLLSSRGQIVKRNQDLLAAFNPQNTNDAGLDAVCISTNGEVLFSIQSNVVVSSTLTLHPGDLLSDQGKVVVPHRRLLEKFQPASSVLDDYGLDALHILPHGEIWFSVERGFTDAVLGPVDAGDLLSNLGYRVFRNQDLTAPFGPGAGKSYGLDALFVIADTEPPR
ncbi:MAG TPA: hypothetical protein VN673_10560, partial [Clostridia bacterium]|nr:hypothetical protein [Clostridia bacterium]